MKTELTRGGRKLEAAIVHFGIAARVRGASAIDVGASTGGFVSVLLACGATRVCAIDAGHGQLAPDLARDPRVTSLERTEFKTASLTVAPGPYDFFTVDVSFVAARSMLRGLAFRLRDGAEGVVLVKPQFELPSHLVKDGKVDAPELRRRALDTFSAKAQRLGFALLGSFDSPVAGGSGTVEILAHLRFAGRPEAMPRLGERKPARLVATKVSKATAKLAAKLRWFAVAAPGLEAPLCAELAGLAQVEDAHAVEGGVEFSGGMAAGMAANLCSRIATRVLLRLGEVKARDFAPLRRSLAKFPWASFVPGDHPLRVEVTTGHCRLYHTGALAETVELAVADCVGELPKREKTPGGPPGSRRRRRLHAHLPARAGRSVHRQYGFLGRAFTSARLASGGGTRALARDPGRGRAGLVRLRLGAAACGSHVWRRYLRHRGSVHGAQPSARSRTRLRLRALAHPRRASVATPPRIRLRGAGRVLDHRRL